MTYQDRRQFLRRTSLVGAGVASNWSGMATAFAGPEADLVVFNANVHTMNRAAPRASAFAIKGNRLVAVGTTEEIKGLIAKGTRTYDAQGMTIVPGFIDSHNHPIGETLLYEVIVGNPFEVEIVAIEAIVEKLRAKAAKTPSGQWVEGFFFDDTKVKDGRKLTATELDKVSTTHPVMVLHRGGHTAYFNHKALELGKITRETPEPAGGTYDKLPNGELSGLVTDTAMFALRALGQRAERSEAERSERALKGLAHISQEFARYGLTGVVHSPGDVKSVMAVRRRGLLKHRANLEIKDDKLDAIIEAGLQTGFGDEWVRLGSTWEHLADGSFSERTMAISTPYPGTSYKGNLTQTQEELNNWVEKVYRAGLQPNCHANGDVAIASVLTAYERAQRLFPRKDVRPRITHCTLLNPDLIRRIKALDAIPLIFTTYAYYNSDKFRFYGEALMQNAMAFRSLLDAGVHVAAGSDFFPGPFAPLMGIQGMVTRTGWDGSTWGANQRVTVEEAIRINTLHGAYGTHEDGLKGSIEVGKLADYVVLADDPMKVDPSKIKDIKIVQTVVGGDATYQA